ncbi:hypothetical protein ACOMHN_017705 [Nucella lapillus]
MFFCLVLGFLCGHCGATRGDLGSRGDDVVCPSGWEALHRACYRFKTQPASSWNEAKSDCERDGAQLLSVGDVSKKNQIRKRLRQLDEGIHRTWWVGLHKNRSQWIWLDGQPANFRITPWVPGEPNNQGRNGENCGEMNDKGDVNDKECNAIRPFVCEKPSEKAASNHDQSKGQHNDGGDDDDNDGNNRGRKGGKKKDKDGDDEEDELYELYEGCYTKESRHRRKKQRPFLYTKGSETCPHVAAKRTQWPETQHGDVATRPCRRGKEGNMTFTCGGTPTCWREEPNVDQCASKAFRKLLKRNLTEPLEPEETLAVTSELANVTQGDDVTEEDITVSSNLIKALGRRRGEKGRIRDKRKVKSIVANMVRAGSNLVSRKKTRRVWAAMGRRDKVHSATSLLVAMETASVAMAEDLEEPTTIVTRDENIELELRVVLVSSSGPEQHKDVTYSAEDSDTKFSISLKTLSRLSAGGLAKMVFMTHYTMGSLLDDANDDDNEVVRDGEESNGEAGASSDGGDDPSPQLASYVVSASVASSGQSSKHLAEPVTFTITHTRKIPPGYQSLCAFWKIDESSGLGWWSEEGCRKVSSNDTHTQCQCDHMTNFAVLMSVNKVQISDSHKRTLRVVTIVGCVISCLCLLASWITFTGFSSLQGERNSIHKHLVTCLFIAEVVFLGGISQTENRVACGVVAGFLHYFFLATFMWMMMEAVHIIFMLVQVFDASRSRMPYYYAAAYATPLLVVAISAGVYSGGYGTKEHCWLTTERGFIWSFAGPVAVILFVNTVVLIYAMTMVCRHSDYVFSTKDKSSAGSIRSWIQGAMALEVLLGLTWILGFFFLSEQSVAVAYIFTILNSTQGLFIFFFHCILNKKARKEYRRVLKMQKKPASSTGTGTHSASLARNKLTTTGPSTNTGHNTASTQDTAPTSV